MTAPRDFLPVNASDLCIFLTIYSAGVAVACGWSYFRQRTWLSGLSLLLAAAAVSAATVVGYHLDSDKSYVAILKFVVAEHDFSAAVSVTLGAAAALIWFIALPGDAVVAASDTRPYFRRQPILVHAMLAASLIGTFVCAGLFVWKDLRGVQRDPVVRVLAPEFTIDKVADLEFQPIRVVVDETGRVFVSYSYYESWGDMGGAIVEVYPDRDHASYQSRIVADSPLLMRPYGLAARGGDLFVSRTGLAAHAGRGKITYDATGAITRLRDLNGDGYFEYADDLVTGMPGSRGPDTMHQNNGITFDRDGNLFVTCASPDDRSLDDHPWGGSVLKCSPDFSQVEVFAQGFRNPFGIAIGPEGELFATDNDVDINPGDELNHVVRGGHYGHPYVIPNEPFVQPSGFVAPILLGPDESNYLGLVYADHPDLPEPYRNCFYMTDFMQNKIWRLKLARDGATFKVVDLQPFATISSPVDIAIGPNGDFYCISRRTENVYRIRLKQRKDAK